MAMVRLFPNITVWGRQQPSPRSSKNHTIGRYREGQTGGITALQIMVNR
jgi:hypothetical protein